MTRPGGGGNIGLPDFPLTSPGNCGARFLRQQEAGVSRLWADRHTQGVRTGMPKLPGMGAAVAHEISPELVLVCPELRAHALTLLPTLDPDALSRSSPARRPPAPVEPRPSPVVDPPRLVVVERPRPVRAEPPRPPVEPELRAPLPVALAAYTTEALLLGAARGVALIAVIAAVAFILAR